MGFGHNVLHGIDLFERNLGRSSEQPVEQDLEMADRCDWWQDLAVLVVRDLALGSTSWHLFEESVGAVWNVGQVIVLVEVDSRVDSPKIPHVCLQCLHKESFGKDALRESTYVCLVCCRRLVGPLLAIDPRSFLGPSS